MSLLNPLLSPTWLRWRLWCVEHDSVAHQALQENLLRLPWMLGATLPLFGIGLLLAWGLSTSANAMGGRFFKFVGWIDVAMLLWLSVLIAVIHYRKLTHRITAFSRTLPALLALNFILLGATFSILSQWMVPSATMYVLSCSFVGTMLLLRPSVMLGVYVGGFVFFYFGVALTAANTTTTLELRFHGGIAAALGMCLSLLLWRRYTVTELLRRKVSIQHHELQLSTAELARQKLLLEDLAQQDALTGLLNRREFEVRAQRLLQRARRDGAGVAAMMLDLDYFKRVNDQYGHPAGDTVIKFMADVLRSSLRDTDVIARVGGEEFMALLPNTTAAAAAVVAEKIRLKVCATWVEAGPDKMIAVTVSVGVSELTADQTDSFEALYCAVDDALYDAKRAGRNRVKTGHVSAAVAAPD